MKEKSGNLDVPLGVNKESASRSGGYDVFFRERTVLFANQIWYLFENILKCLRHISGFHSCNLR